ncbi:MAG TPA: hypothetical protein VI197_06360 [Polyangiaceae bacterium]
MVAAVETGGPVVVDAPACDRGEKNAPCPNKAVFAYQWDWGERGTCCAIHATLLNQVASQIGRGVVMHQLAESAPAPLSRDERTKLKAAALVLEEELEETKTRALELYRVNTQLQGEVRMHKTRNREVTAQLDDAKAEVELLQEEHAKLTREAAAMALELEHYKTLESLQPTERAVAKQLTSGERRALGLEDEPQGAVVDGGPSEG